MNGEGVATCIILSIASCITSALIMGLIISKNRDNFYIEKDYLVKEGVAEYYIGENYNKEFRLIKRKE